MSFVHCLTRRLSEQLYTQKHLLFLRASSQGIGPSDRFQDPNYLHLAICLNFILSYQWSYWLKNTPPSNPRRGSEWSAINLQECHFPCPWDWQKNKKTILTCRHSFITLWGEWRREKALWSLWRNTIPILTSLFQRMRACKMINLQIVHLHTRRDLQGWHEWGMRPRTRDWKAQVNSPFLVLLLSQLSFLLSMPEDSLIIGADEVCIPLYRSWVSLPQQLTLKLTDKSAWVGERVACRVTMHLLKCPELLHLPSSSKHELASPPYPASHCLSTSVYLQTFISGKHKIRPGFWRRSVWMKSAFGQFLLPMVVRRNKHRLNMHKSWPL